LAVWQSLGGKSPALEKRHPLTFVVHAVPNPPSYPLQTANHPSIRTSVVLCRYSPLFVRPPSPSRSSRRCAAPSIRNNSCCFSALADLTSSEAEARIPSIFHPFNSTPLLEASPPSCQEHLATLGQPQLHSQFPDTLLHLLQYKQESWSTETRSSLRHGSSPSESLRVPCPAFDLACLVCRILLAPGRTTAVIRPARAVVGKHCPLPPTTQPRLGDTIATTLRLTFDAQVLW